MKASIVLAAIVGSCLTHALALPTLVMPVESNGIESEVYAYGMINGQPAIQFHDGEAPPPPILMKPEDFTDYANLVEKLEMLDRWIMFPHGGGYKDEKESWVASGRYFIAENMTNGLFGPGSDRTYMELARTTVTMIKAQGFINGNHRTATLALLDFLAAHNIQYEEDPIQLYIDLQPSTYTYTPIDELIPKIARKIKKSISKTTSMTTDEIRNHYALRIKFSELMFHRTNDYRSKMNRTHELIEMAQGSIAASVAQTEVAKKLLKEQKGKEEIVSASDVIATAQIAVITAIDEARISKKKLKEADEFEKKVIAKWWPQKGTKNWKLLDLKVKGERIVGTKEQN